MVTGYKPNDFAAKSVAVVVVVVIIFDGFVSITQCSLQSFLYSFANNNNNNKNTQLKEQAKQSNPWLPFVFDSRTGDALTLRIRNIISGVTST